MLNHSGESLHIQPGHRYPIELELGSTEETSPIFLVRNEAAQLRASHVILQPDVVKTDWRLGWIPLGGDYPSHALLGRGESLRFRLGPDVQVEQLEVMLEPDGAIEIADFTDNGTYVIAHLYDLSDRSEGMTGRE